MQLQKEKRTERGSGTNKRFISNNNEGSGAKKGYIPKKKKDSYWNPSLRC